MTYLVFDAPSGISGDMTLGALVDLGVPLDVMQEALATLPVRGWRLHAETVKRHSIAATQVRVEQDPAAEQPHRHLADVVAILRGGALPERARVWAEQVFERLAHAEAAVHRTTVEKVHFHEVGAVDAIVDIAGACVGLDWLGAHEGVDDFRFAQLRVGRGTVETEHGMMPVPAPATARLLEGLPVQFSRCDGERVTPTGAALLAALARPLGDELVRLGRSGYGAGTRTFPDAANLLRVFLAAPVEETVGKVAVLRTTIDDMQPELYEVLMERSFAAGALDVQLDAVWMKKARPGVRVTVIARPEDATHLAEVLLNESTTLGVRIASEVRVELPRRAGEVQTEFGPIAVKVATRPDGRERALPEYESVRQAAAAAGVPVDDVYRAALRAAGAQQGGRKQDADEAG